VPDHVELHGIAPRAGVGFAGQLDPVKRPPFTLAARHDQPAVQHADSQQVIDPPADLILV
jgi:hypothetical protein